MSFYFTKVRFVCSLEQSKLYHLMISMESFNSVRLVWGLVPSVAGLSCCKLILQKEPLSPPSQPHCPLPHVPPSPMALFSMAEFRSRIWSCLTDTDFRKVLTLYLTLGLLETLSLELRHKTNSFTISLGSSLLKALNIHLVF